MRNGALRGVGFVAAFIAMAAAAPQASALAADGQVRAGAAVVDGTYHVGNSAGQYATTRAGGYGPVDPNAQSVKNQASYGVQSRESVRAIVVQGADGKLVAIVSDDHYIPQDALWRRTAQLISARTNGAINESNLTMAVTHNHSSPSYSSLDWGVWTFQDVFDFRFFDYYANQNANALYQAYTHLHNVRVSATVSRFDAFQRNPMGPAWADDGTPDGFPRSYTDHDLSVVHFQNIDDAAHPKALATLVNIGQHPEMLMGYDLISGEWPATMERFVDRTVGGVTMLTQNATGTSEVERDNWHPVHQRELFDHAQYNQMEWGARQLADAVIGDVGSIDAQQPNPDTNPTPYGGTSYHDRFVAWMSHFPVAMQDRWFGGPVSHPYPGVSSCKTSAAFQGDPRLPVVGLPDCMDMPWGNSLQPVTRLGGASPGISTSTFEALGIPIPENYSFPSTGALEDTVGVHMQAFRFGEILFTICSCEQWVEQSYNIKTRTDTVPGNEYVGYDPTSPNADPSERCVKNNDGSYSDDGSGTGTWSCTTADPKPQTKRFADGPVEHMRAEILNDAARWDDPTCLQLGCGAQAESEPAAFRQIFGNFTHDDTTARGGSAQSASYARTYGYKLTVPIAMANDYNGYIASYREYMDHDHYRKALTGWGPHSSDYYATRLAQLGHALKGDAAAQAALDQQTDVAKASPGWAPLAAKEVADQRQEESKVQAVGEAAAAGVRAYNLTVPNDGGVDAEMSQPRSIQRFDAATFTWDGGNNYTDNPVVVVQRRTQGHWTTFADQSGEVPVTLHYPASAGCFNPGSVYGGDPTNGDLPNPNPSQLDPSCAAGDGQAVVDGTVGARLAGQAWRWTATFEAFVSRFPLVDPQSHAYTATPVGTYRFVVHGRWRKGGADAPYLRVSNPFHVKPWNGITVDGATLDAAGHLTFAAGPAHRIAEREVRRSDRPPLAPNDAPVTFTIGPVDFPDTVANQHATGAWFLNGLRGYSATSTTEAEHYCLDCTFRPWLDATDQLVARVVITRAGGGTTTEWLTPDANGRFVSATTLSKGDSARIAIRDAWGDRTATPEQFTA